MATYIPVESQSDVDKIWMREALDMVISLIFCIFIVLLMKLQAQEAFDASEIPVGCVFVEQARIGTSLYNQTEGRGRCITKARNRTNELRNVSYLK